MSLHLVGVHEVQLLMPPPALFTFPLLPQQLGCGLALHQRVGGTSQPASPGSGSSLIYGRTHVHSLCPYVPPLLLAPQLELVPQPPFAKFSTWLSADLSSRSASVRQAFRLASFGQRLSSVALVPTSWKGPAITGKAEPASLQRASLSYSSPCKHSCCT